MDITRRNLLKASLLSCFGLFPIKELKAYSEIDNFVKLASDNIKKHSNNVKSIVIYIHRYSEYNRFSNKVEVNKNYPFYFNKIVCDFNPPAMLTIPARSGDDSETIVQIAIKEEWSRLEFYKRLRNSLSFRDLSKKYNNITVSPEHCCTKIVIG